MQKKNYMEKKLCSWKDRKKNKTITRIKYIKTRLTWMMMMTKRYVHHIYISSMQERLVSIGESEINTS